MFAAAAAVSTLRIPPGPSLRLAPSIPMPIASFSGGVALKAEPDGARIAIKVTGSDFIWRPPHSALSNTRERLDVFALLECATAPTNLPLRIPPGRIVPPGLRQSDTTRA